MKDLNYQLMKLCRTNRDGSFSTQATRRRILDRIANQLHALGYQHMQATSLKPKHVAALVSLWKDQGLSVGTLKNLLSGLRWWAGKIGKDDMIPKDNDAFDIGKRRQLDRKHTNLHATLDRVFHGNAAELSPIAGHHGRTW